MAEVQQKRAPRLPKGPPRGLDPDDEVISDSPETGETTNTQTTTPQETKEDIIEGKRAKIPEPPSKSIRATDSDVLYSYLASLKPEHWVQLSWYLYRTYPIIIRPDEQKYIECNVIPIDEEYLLKNHGSGEYKFIMNDSSRPKGAKSLLTAYMKINDPDHPPLLNYAELDVDHPNNRRFVEQAISKGLMTTDRKPMNTTQQGGAGNDQLVRLLEKLIDKSDKNQLAKLNDPTDTAINKAFEVMARGNQAATEMMLSQMKQDDPEKLLKLMTMMMGMMRPTETKTNGDDGMLMKFMSIMADKDKTIMSMMEKMMELTVKAATPKVSVDAEGGDAFDKMIDRYLKIQELTGAVGGGGGGKKSTLEVIMQYGMPVADKAFGIIQNLLALKAGAQVPQPQQTNPMIANKDVIANAPQTNPPVSIASNPELGTDIASAMGDGTAHTQVGQTEQGGVVLNESMIRMGLLQMAPMLIGALDRGQSGDEFAEGIDKTYGPKAYDLVANIGLPKMLEYLKSEPTIWAQLAPRELAVTTFLKQFLMYGSDDDATIPPDDGNNGDEPEVPKEGADVEQGKPNSTKRGVIN